MIHENDAHESEILSDRECQSHCSVFDAFTVTIELNAVIERSVKVGVERRKEKFDE